MKRGMRYASIEVKGDAEDEGDTAEVGRCDARGSQRWSIRTNPPIRTSGYVEPSKEKVNKHE